MKLISLQENLKQGLFITSHIAGKNVNLPILSNVMIEVRDGNIKLIATNLEIGVIHNIRGKVEKEGSFTVDSKIISDYINLLPNQKAIIEQKDNNLLINCENYKTKIKGQSSEDFPLIPQVEKKEFYSVNANEFKKALNNIIFAVSNNELRLELSGVLFNFTDNNLILVATDSYRLAEKKIKINANIKKEERKIIIPAKTLQEMIRILSAGSETEDIENNKDIKFYVSENQILFSYGSTELVSRLIEGQYPDYQQIIPNNIKTNITVNRAELVRAIKMASIFSKAGINDVNLDFPQGKNKIIITSASGQTGENTAEIDANINGNDNGIVVNYRYLLDGLNNIDGETVKIEVIDGNTPCILRPENNKEEYLYIIMPIKQ